MLRRPVSGTKRPRHSDQRPPRSGSQNSRTLVSERAAKHSDRHLASSSFWPLNNSTIPRYCFSTTVGRVPALENAVNVRGGAQGLAQANGQCHTSNESSPHKAVEEFRLTYCGDSKTKYFMKFGPEMNEAANAMQASRPLKFPTRANPGWERVSRVRCVLITFQNQSVVNPALWITCERN
jgi:hypothetical protein